MASTYGRVRAAKAAKVANGIMALRSADLNMAGTSGLIAAATVARPIGSARVAKRNSDGASITQARATLARTAAARSAAASRSVVRRPIGQRVCDNANKASSDGQTRSYYRMQGGKRVLVSGYATPQR